MRYKAVVSYFGINYVGWQTQSNGLAIQEVIEKVISKICNEKIAVISSGRTDGKVHAIGQVFHFDASKDFRCDYLLKAINGNLPNDIYIKDIVKVSNDFHARFHASGKRYDYLINLGPYDVFTKDLAFQCRYDLDLEYMGKCSKLFIGTHDFGAFCGNSYETHPNQVRTINRLDLILEGNKLRLVFEGAGFLRYMVRMITGTLIEAARHRIDEDYIKYMLESRDKEACKWNAKPYGLYLVYVKYDNLDKFLLK